MSHKSEIKQAEFIPAIARQIKDELWPQLSVELGKDDQRAVLKAIIRAASLGMSRGQTEAIADINEWWHGLTLDRRLGQSTTDPLIRHHVEIDDSVPQSPDH